MNNHTDLFLGIDLGTSGCRICIIDRNRDIVAESRAELPSLNQQNTKLWISALMDAFHQIKPQSLLAQIKSLSFDATSGTLFLCSPDGEQLTDILFYNDKRAQNIKAFTDTSYANKNCSSLAKVLWLLQHQKPTNQFIVMHQADYLLYTLTGHINITDENNALKLGYDAQRQVWPQWIRDTLGNHYKILPSVVAPGHFISKISLIFAHNTGISQFTHIYTGTTDSIAACMATESYSVGDAITSLGSTIVLKIVSDTPIDHADYGIYSHRYGKQWLVGGASNSGGAVLAKYFTTDEIKTLSMQINNQASSPLNYYPLPDIGERFPINDPNKNPCLKPRPHTSVEFLQGLLEGMARIEKEGYTLLEQLGAPKITRIQTVGGGASNLTWQNIRHRIIKKDISPATHTEAAYGCALLAMHSFEV